MAAIGFISSGEPERPYWRQRSADAVPVSLTSGTLRNLVRFKVDVPHLQLMVRVAEILEWRISSSYAWQRLCCVRRVTDLSFESLVGIDLPGFVGPPIA